MSTDNKKPAEALLANVIVNEGENTINFSINTQGDRIRKFEYRKKMLEDNFYQQLYHEMEKTVVSSKETALIKQIDDTNNVFKMVIEEISKVYSKEPERTFDEKEQESIEELYDELEVDDIMSQANIYINAFNDCLLQVGFKNEKITLRLRTPTNTIVKTDDDLELEEVYIYTGRDNNNNQIWYGYTESSIFKIIVPTPNDVLNHDENKRQPIDDTSNDMGNHFGFIPFIAIHNGFRDNEFWQCYKGDDLVKATIQIALKLSFLNQLIKFQSFKLLKVEGSNLDGLDGMEIDPSKMLYVQGQDTKIDLLNLESNYKMLWDTIKEIIQSVAVNYKISPNLFRMTAAPSSGFALQMENIKLDNFVKSQQKIFRKVEKKLFNMIKKISDDFGLGFINSDVFNIEFNSMEYPKSDMEKLEEQEKEISLGKTNMIKILMKELDIDEDEATQIYQENLEVQKKQNGLDLNMNTTARELGLEPTDNSKS